MDFIKYITTDNIITGASVTIAAITVISKFLKDKNNKAVLNYLCKNKTSKSIIEFFDIISESTIADFIQEAAQFKGYSNSMKKLYVRKQIIKQAEKLGVRKPSDSIINVAIETIFNKLKFGDK